MNKDTRSLTIFLAATFLWTWLCYAPIVAGRHTPTEMPWMIFLILGGMGPSLVGIVMVLTTYDRGQRRDFWRRSFSCKQIKAGWWGFIFLIFPLLLGASIALDVVLGGNLPGFDQLTSLLANPLLWPLVAFISFMSGPWSEEFGWRGFALDRFLKRFGIVNGSALLGLVWGIWHLPLYFMSNNWHSQMGFKPAGFWAFLVLNTGLALLMTWVYLSTGRSILSGLLMHFTSNFSAQLIAPSSDRFEIIRSVLILAVGLVLCLQLERKSRKEQALVPDLQPQG